MRRRRKALLLVPLRTRFVSRPTRWTSGSGASSRRGGTLRPIPCMWRKWTSASRSRGPSVAVSSTTFLWSTSRFYYFLSPLVFDRHVFVYMLVCKTMLNIAGTWLYIQSSCIFRCALILVVYLLMPIENLGETWVLIYELVVC